ncbi:hypothetical protein AGMMS49975_29920 [Clostridia bacterium]|nr:hypothetical protein AGMMS49975_29920 [Clostridia bacterium]
MFQLFYDITDKFVNQSSLETDFDNYSTFNIFGKASRSNLQGLLNSELVDEWKNKCVIGLFDFDDAYKIDYQAKLKTGNQNFWEELSNDVSKGLYKKRKTVDMYAVVLPVPEFRKNIAGVELDKSYLEVELLFTDEVLERIFDGQDYAKERLAGGISIPKVRNKECFWRKCVELDKDDFSAFDPLFGLIEELINSSTQKLKD